jgi:hypothetical protein
MVRNLSMQKKYLPRCCSIFSRFLSIFKSRELDIEKNVSSEEETSRFINHRRDFTASTGRVKHTVFMPMFNDDTKRFETSVYRTDSLAPEIVWEIAKKYVSIEKKIPYARAVVKVKDYQVVDLNVQSTPHPHRLHADVINWPAETQKQILICKKIRNSVFLKEYPY